MRWAVVLAALSLPAVAVADVAEPPGYRGPPYRAPVPATLAGATVLDTAAVHHLWQRDGAVFVDVMPQPPRPENLPDDTVWRQPARDTIPGAIWLPNVGYEVLSDVDARYLEEGLAVATGGDPGVALVFFCLADCWMSWNAAKRAIEGGYADVSWYPEGTDGWASGGLPTEAAQPWVRP